MRKFVLFLLLSFFLSPALFGQKIEAYLSNGNFKTLQEKNYTEAYISILGRSLVWKNLGSKLHAQLEITLLMYKDTNIVNFSKEKVDKFTQNDSTAHLMNIIYVQRLLGDTGTYKIKVLIDDLNDTSKAIRTTYMVNFDHPKHEVTLSSIMPVKSYSKSFGEGRLSKSGYDLLPNIFNFYPTQDSILNIYAEIYPSDSITLGDDFLISYYIKNHENQEIIPKYKRFKRLKWKNANVLLTSMNISGLASGNFDFVIEIISKNNKKLAFKEFYFQRENTNVKMSLDDIASVNIAQSFAERIHNKDTLILLLKSMLPITTGAEKEFVQNLIRKSKPYYMQQFLLSFWEKRNYANPQQAFEDYMKEVATTEKLFSTFINHGFETDRGRVFLQYGAPNSISKDYHDPSAYPYEIWHYYTLNQQRNRKFIFYSTSISSNEFFLLHSDAIGEPNDPQWRIHLRQRDSGYKSFDQTGEEEDNWGNQYNEWFNLPR